MKGTALKWDPALKNTELKGSTKRYRTKLGSRTKVYRSRGVALKCTALNWDPALKYIPNRGPALKKYRTNAGLCLYLEERGEAPDERVNFG